MGSNQKGVTEIMGVVMIFVVVMGLGFILFCFMQHTSEKLCQEHYGKDWHSITKGQFYCEDSKGNLRSAP